MRAVVRERLLDVTAELICAEGWAAVTMSRVADQVGVSRQLVYKQLGGKGALGEAVVSREVERILGSVVEKLREHGGDPLAGIPAAVEFVLRTGAENPLIKAVLLGRHGGDDGLLPLLTTRPEPVLGPATEVVLAEVRVRYADLAVDDDVLARVVEIVVRLTLSHLLQPSGPVEEALAQIRIVIEGALARYTRAN